MNKYTIRKEFIKLKNNGLSYNKCKLEIVKKFNKDITIRTLKNWWKRFNESDWDLEDNSQRPKTIHLKFSDKDEQTIKELRGRFGYGPKKIRIKAQREGINMSISTIGRIIKQKGLSKGSKMEGMVLRPKWVRFERPYPNDMWQIDGDQNDDKTWRVPTVDDCSRYCLGVFTIEHNTTEEMIRILEILIKINGKPKQILTDNGSEFGGPKGWDSDFDKWCDRNKIIPIRSGVHKPTTVGKISAMQRTIQAELPHWKGDLELWRMMYNHERPHESLRGLTPADIYFEFKRYKKHYEL